MLKNLMEEKQLDFSQPFLSVRRFSSTAITSEVDDKRTIDKQIPKLPPLPFYKSELKSGPISNPGTVPFVWEKSPGEPKDERKSCSRLPKQPPTAPKLPPGRVSNIKQDSAISTLRPKEDLESDKPNTVNDDISTHGKGDEKEEGHNSKSCSEDDDEAYLDALDTLSRSESFSMVCSVSGVSGLDGPDLKPSGTFSTDQQTRDFMMGRFLPAAKAMASETPQYAHKKQLVVWDRARQVDKAMNGENRIRPFNHYQPNGLPPYAQELRSVESDNESDIFEGSDIISAKVCGLFPRFCLKSSFFVMNQVPVVKMQSRVPASSVRRVRGNSSSASRCSEPKIEHVEDVVCEAEVNEGRIELKSKPNEIGEKNGSKGQRQGDDLSPNCNRFSQSKLPEPKGFLKLPEKANNNSTQSGFDVRKSRLRNFRQLLADENAEHEVGSGIPVVEKTLYIDSVHKPKSPSSNSSSTDLKSLNDFEIPEKSSDVEVGLSLDSSLQDVKHSSVVTEKTQATPKSLESSDSCSLSSSGRFTHEKQNGPRRDGDLIHGSLALVVSKVGYEETFDTEKCHDLVKDSFTSSEVLDSKMDSKSRQPFGVDIEKSFSRHFETLDERKKIDLKTPKNVKLGVEERHSNARIWSSTTKMSNNGLIDLESQWLVKLGNEEKPHESFLQMTLSLPSPKSPSESWLKRALPVASSRNSRSTLASRIGISSLMESPLDPKWETIVKTSNVQQGRLRFTEEHLAPIPEA